MGLVIFGAMALYLVLAIFVVARATKYARERGTSVMRWGWSAALLMFLIPFWDWLPTVAAYQYYCATKSGFWVYKSVDQWKKENPGVIERLPAPNASGSPTVYERFNDGRGVTNTFLLSKRFNWIVIQQDISFVLPIIRQEQQVKDVIRNEVLARYIDFATGNSVKNTVGPPGPLKFWLHSGHCSGGPQNRDAIRHFRDQFIGPEKSARLVIYYAA